MLKIAPDNSPTSSTVMNYLQNQTRHKNLDRVAEPFFCEITQFAAFYVQSRRHELPEVYAIPILFQISIRYIARGQAILL